MKPQMSWDTISGVDWRCELSGAEQKDASFAISFKVGNRRLIVVVSLPLFERSCASIMP